MPGLIRSGWKLSGMGSEAVTIDVGVAVGGGRFTLDIDDQQRGRRKLRYGGFSLGGGVGVHADAEVVTEMVQRFVNSFLALFRGGVNSLDLPSAQSEIFLIEFMSRPAPLVWGEDILGKSILMYSIGVGAGLGIGGTLIFFFPHRNAARATVPMLMPINGPRAVAFSAGIQLGQLGLEALWTPALNG